jgi:hypothetical protein
MISQAAEGRVFEFDDEVNQPRVRKTAFFP